MPSLTADELEKLDNMRNLANGMLKPVPEDALVRKEVVMQMGEDGAPREPATNKAWLLGDQETQRECGYCRKYTSDMPQCARWVGPTW